MITKFRHRVKIVQTQQEPNYRLNELLINWRKLGIISLGILDAVFISIVPGVTFCNPDFIAMGCKMVISDINKIMWALIKLMLPSFYQECTNKYWSMKVILQF